MTQCQKIDIQFAQPETSDIILHKRNLNFMATQKTLSVNKFLLCVVIKHLRMKARTKTAPELTTIQKLPLIKDINNV